MIANLIEYILQTREYAILLFQFVSSRYEKRPTLYTSNKSFCERGEILGDYIIKSAVLDRISHHKTVVNIKRESNVIKGRRNSAMLTVWKE